MQVPSRIKPYLYVSCIILVFVIPIALTLNTVQHPLQTSMTSPNPTPLGYTVSLLIFILPMSVISIWFLFNSKIAFQKKAFYLTLGILIPLGVILDLLFAHAFFTFKNHGAVTGWTIPGVGGPIPIEEFIFYLSGFAFVLLLYVWGDEFWFDRYNVPDYQSSASHIDRILHFHSSSLIIALLLICIAVIYKKMFSEVPKGLPWYMIYLTLVALVPAIGFMKTARAFINWRSFSFTFMIVVLVSIIWETSLALPYQWWDYQHKQMMGLFIKAWHQLPLEAVLVWFSVSFTTIILYETIKIWLASDKTMRKAFFGM